ncbi:unnamed protein product [Arctia plantaginis]|uniref:Uncharacterized protein n=1 Tax=Arctia plantaginis TaxID=874455 RepID=A0A8S0ZSJ5_ARCPL|nr:unnamed protein product [Arctia plantaginis]CAB3237626.1 unnamed protein product [Arctia plantaginis]
MARANRDPDFFNQLIEHNPIPGLIIRAGRIINNDAIMPAAYDAAMVYHDASAVRALMNYTSAKMRDVNIITGQRLRQKLLTL